MKKFVLIFLLIPAVLCSQEEVLPFKKCNTIKIRGVNLIEFSKHLQLNGFTIEKLDKEIETLETHPFKLWKSSGQTGVIFGFMDGENLMITGNAISNFMGSSTTMKMEKRGTGNMAGKLFEIINETAKKFAGENSLQISYLLL